MPFDPTKPATKSKLSSAEMRAQLNALNDKIEAQAALIAALQTALISKPSMDDVNAAIVANSSDNSNSVVQLDLQPSDPPTQIGCAIRPFTG